jgi:hypothetical protein
MSMTVTTPTCKASLCYYATYGGADGLAPLHGTLSRDNSQLVFLADSGEILFPTDTEWYLYGQVHGEVGLAVTQALLDTARAQAERRVLEATNRLQDVA